MKKGRQIEPSRKLEKLRKKKIKEREDRDTLKDLIKRVTMRPCVYI